MQMRVLCEPWQSLKLGEGGKICHFSLKRAGEESALFEVLAASYPGCGRAARRSLTTVQTAAAPLVSTTLKNSLCSETSKQFLLRWNSLSYLFEWPDTFQWMGLTKTSDGFARLTPLL